MRDLDDLRSQLKAAHAVVMQMAKGIKRQGNDKAEYDLLIGQLSTEDKWIEFKRKAKDFIALYEALSPDPSVLDFTADLKWVANFLRYGTLAFEKREALDQAEYSEKIRSMLDQHLDVTGLSMTVKLRHITDPGFFDDFELEDKAEDELQTAAIRKTAELKRTTYARLEDNEHRYGKFSDRLRELLEKMDSTQLTWAEKLQAAEDYAKDLLAEDKAHEGSDLNHTEYGLWQVTTSFTPSEMDEDNTKALARAAHEIYADDQSAPPLWQDKAELKKSLRQRVRLLAHENGLNDLRGYADQVEDFAIKHLSKV